MPREMIERCASCNRRMRDGWKRLCRTCERRRLNNLCDELFAASPIKRGTAPCRQNAGMDLAAADLLADFRAEVDRLRAERDSADPTPAAPDQAEGPQPPKNVPEPTGEFGHFCPACRALVRWNAQHGWYFCQRCNKARGAVEIMYFRGNQLDAEGYTVDPRDAASKMREIL